MEQVIKAEGNLKKRKKPVEAGRLVAELNFGFWTSLFNKNYEINTKNCKTPLWPEFLESVFPLIPSEQRTRKNISQRLDSIRKIRNRVFHYEPIYFLPDLENLHFSIIETIGWFSSDLKNIVTQMDQFPRLHKLLKTQAKLSSSSLDA